MAIFRQLQTNFWDDIFISELTCKERYFYIYLLQSSMVLQCGIYPFNKRKACCQLGFEQNELEELLKAFVDYGKILHDESTEEVMIVNWYKYNNISRSTNVRKCVNSELKRIKCSEFIQRFHVICQELCSGHPEEMKEIFNGICVHPQVQPDEQCEASSTSDFNENHGDEPLEGTDAADELAASRTGSGTKKVGFSEVMHAYEKHIHPMSEEECFILEEWCSRLSPKAVQTAILQANRQGKRSISYLEGIMKNWMKSKGGRKNEYLVQS